MPNGFVKNSVSPCTELILLKNIGILFSEKYQNGATPNPDILCNKHIKFDKFFKLVMQRFNADAIATGHYARSSFGPFLEQFQPDSDAKLLQAYDKNKDQTYFLSQISQEALRHTMFPLGEYYKSNVKKIALNAGFDLIVKKKESMGICFIGKRDFKNFIAEYIQNKVGDFIDLENGEILERHSGIHHYTVGQRIVIKHKPCIYFLYHKNIEAGRLTLVKENTNHPALYGDFLLCKDPHWISEEPSELRTNKQIFKCDFRFQHRNPQIPCKVCKLRSGDLAIQLSTPLRALTKGQYCIFYRGKECLGGAEISYPGPSYFMLDQKVTKYVISYQQEQQRLEKICSINKMKNKRTINVH
ncbi:mitochondrial tRNA-specific 2-thiouridylase 1 isoform X2 [Prorops nasuta]|uniref:mitochondrial tRNA-specific 2-thiouridylase 1 isoform X2 n=1 Tax=Prorops nasuta TaxID=863751 RepID=UPI0034CD91ED